MGSDGAIESGAVQTMAAAAPAAQITLPPSAVEDRIVNLDAGGAQRWAETEYDFGDEPGDEPFSQVWSCQHSFKVYEAATDEVDHSELSRMECNRCLEPVSIAEMVAALKPSKRRKEESTSKDGRRADQQLESVRAGKSKQALECSRCRLVVCPQCRDKYNAECAQDPDD